jgi:hypothetical protein
MKKLIISGLFVVALAFISGCASDPAAHSKTVTTEQTTTSSPVTTTTTDTQTK